MCAIEVYVDCIHYTGNRMFLRLALLRQSGQGDKSKVGSLRLGVADGGTN
jgi:hypothetical protein